MIKSKTGLKTDRRSKHKAMEETPDDISGSEHSMDSRSSTISSKLEAYCPECDIVFKYKNFYFTGTTVKLNMAGSVVKTQFKWKAATLQPQPMKT